jgi:tetratricopeptide (TPR) repeat protein
MRSFTFLALFIFSVSLFGQSAFDIKFSKEVCNCLDNSKNIKNLTEQEFMDCFQKAVQADSDLILQECKRIYGDTSGDIGYRFGKELVERTTISLVKDCKRYFKLVDSLRYEDYKNLDQDSLERQVGILNKTENSKRDDEFYSNKAFLFFELKMYDSALVDIEKALLLNPSNGQSLYCKAWIYEMKGSYDEAISLYDKVAEVTQMKSFYIFSEVAKERKVGCNDATLIGCYR